MMLALSVYQVTINDKLPTTSDAVPLLGRLNLITGAVRTKAYFLNSLCKTLKRDVYAT